MAGIAAVFLATTAVAGDFLNLHITPGEEKPETMPMTLEALDALKQHEFTTTTIWTDGPITFSGVPLKELLMEVDAMGNSVELVALNDYSVSIPMDDVEDTVPIVATRMNGEPISVRDKGPFWIVFPFDSDPKYRTETIYARSIWQLSRLKVVD